MRMTMRHALAATLFVILPASSLAGASAFAQAAGAGPDGAAPTQVVLTQPQIDGLIATEKDIHALQGTAGDSKPDAGTDAKIAAAAKAHGFGSLSQMADVSFSVGLVMAGVDPDTKAFVGPTTVIGKQIAEVKADKTMSPKEKAEALDELQSALQQAGSDKPSPTNITLVTTNYDKLTQAMQPAD